MKSDSLIEELEEARREIEDLRERLRIQTDKALENQQSTERYRNIIETTNAVAWELDIEGLFFNYMAPQIEDLSGYPPETWVDFECWSERIHPEDREDAVAWCKAETTKGEDHIIEYRMLRADGGVVWVRDVISVILENDKPTLLRGHFFNIDDRKAAEQEAMNRAVEASMLRRQKLESLGVMASGIAHDFNNLLAGILGNIDLGLALAKLDSTIATPLQDAKKASEQAADLIGQLLAYSGKEQLALESVDLNNLIRDMWRLLESARSKQVQFVQELDENLPDALVDASLFRQIILNLVINGSDAIGLTPGTIAIATRMANADDDAQWIDRNATPENGGNHFVVVEVKDTGEGIRKADLPKIFDPFFTTKANGRGLGLAAVQGIVSRHNGFIEVDSELGEGTSFKILLPANQQATVGFRTKLDNEISSEFGGRVLVVDDNELVRGTAAKLLEFCGCSVLTASNGGEALALYQEHGDNIDCVLLDMRMPVMNGQETLSQLRKIDRDVKVILTSGYYDASAPKDGDYVFLQKPYSREKLMNAFINAGWKN